MKMLLKSWEALEWRLKKQLIIDNVELTIKRDKK
jgi:hypothetical protein